MIITPAKFEDEMNRINTEDQDREIKHRAADDLICEVLSFLGYDKGVQIFKKMDKWYS